MLRKIFFRLKTWQALSGTIAIAAMMLYDFAVASPPKAIAYISYALSAYLFVLDLFWCVSFYREKLKPGIKNLIDGNKWLSRYLKDAAFKTVVTAYLTLVCNLFYVLMNLACGIYHRSLWSLILSLYYFLMTLMKFLLVKNVKIDSIGNNRLLELKKYRACACILFATNCTLAGMVTLAIKHNKGFFYSGYLIYVMALYAFYNAISTTMEMIRYWKCESPVMSALKVVSLSSSLISVLALETAMLASFYTRNDLVYRNRMIGITGYAMSVLLLAISCCMIRFAAKQIKEMESC